jgi:DNA-directed RNA polymerase specialized sigma24 family protein
VGVSECGPGFGLSINMSGSAESFHETLRNLCVLCASCGLHAFSFSFTAEAQRTQRLRRDLWLEDCFLLLSRSLKRLAAPRKRSHIYFLVSPRFEHARAKFNRLVTNKLDQHFSSLLTFLCPDDPDEAGHRYLRLHQKLEGFFRTRGAADTSAAADETLDRAARRIAEGAAVPNVDNFCLGIARFIIKEGWRFNTRESSAFLQFLEQHEHATAEQIDRFSLMKTCFEQLPQSDQDLLNSYCAALSGKERAKLRRELAEELNRTVSALRIRVTRLRQGLAECLKKLSRNHW